MTHGLERAVLDEAEELGVIRLDDGDAAAAAAQMPKGVALAARRALSMPWNSSVETPPRLRVVRGAPAAGGLTLCEGLQ